MPLPYPTPWGCPCHTQPLRDAPAILNPLGMPLPYSTPWGCPCHTQPLYPSREKKRNLLRGKKLPARFLPNPPEIFLPPSLGILAPLGISTSLIYGVVICTLLKDLQATHYFNQKNLLQPPVEIIFIYHKKIFLNFWDPLGPPFNQKE